MVHAAATAVCRPKSQGGRRCDTHLKQMTVAQLLPPRRSDLPDLAWSVGEKAATEEPAALYGTYSNSVANAALNTLIEAVRHEPQMTDQLQTALAGRGAELKGLQHRIKAPSSLARKIRKKEVEDFLPPAQAAAKLDDTTRYTVATARLSDLVPALTHSVNSLVANGWTVHSAEHSFVKGNPYKGIHIILANSSGQRCEVQFHTTAALEVKGRGHKEYELYRDIDLPAGDRKRAFNRCVKLWDNVPTPPGLRALHTLGGTPVVIKDYRPKEGS